MLRLLGDYVPLTLTGLGELLVCESGTNPSRLVDRTVEFCLVSCDPDADDRRQGHPAADHCKSELHAVGTDAELPTVIAVLERVAAGAPARM